MPRPKFPTVGMRDHVRRPPRWWRGQIASAGSALPGRRRLGDRGTWCSLDTVGGGPAARTGADAGTAPRCASAHATDHLRDRDSARWRRTCRRQRRPRTACHARGDARRAPRLSFDARGGCRTVHSCRIDGAQSRSTSTITRREFDELEVLPPTIRSYTGKKPSAHWTLRPRSWHDH